MTGPHTLQGNITSINQSINQSLSFITATQNITFHSTSWLFPLIPAVRQYSD